MRRSGAVPSGFGKSKTAARPGCSFGRAAEGSFMHTGLAAGPAEYQAVGHNNDGDGPVSEVVTVEVT